MTLFPGVGEVPHGGGGALPGQGLDAAAAGLRRQPRQTQPEQQERPLPRLPQQQPGAQNRGLSQTPARLNFQFSAVTSYWDHVI